MKAREVVGDLLGVEQAPAGGLELFDRGRAARVGAAGDLASRVHRVEGGELVGEDAPRGGAVDRDVDHRLRARRAGRSGHQPRGVGANEVPRPAEHQPAHGGATGDPAGRACARVTAAFGGLVEARGGLAKAAAGLRALGDVHARAERPCGHQREATVGAFERRRYEHGGEGRVGVDVEGLVADARGDAGEHLSEHEARRSAGRHDREDLLQRRAAHREQGVGGGVGDRRADRGARVGGRGRGRRRGSGRRGGRGRVALASRGEDERQGRGQGSGARHGRAA